MGLMKRREQIMQLLPGRSPETSTKTADTFSTPHTFLRKKVRISKWACWGIIQMKLNQTFSFSQTSILTDNFCAGCINAASKEIWESGVLESIRPPDLEIQSLVAASSRMKSTNHRSCTRIQTFRALIYPQWFISLISSPSTPRLLRCYQPAIWPTGRSRRRNACEQRGDGACQGWSEAACQENPGRHLRHPPGPSTS